MNKLKKLEIEKSKLEQQKGDLEQQKEDLERQKKEIESLIKETDKSIAEKNKKMGQCYYDFFMKKTNKDFVLYEKYPSLASLQYYARYFPTFPLYQYGIFKIDELAEIIKQLYQYTREEFYDIFTLGMTCEKTEKDHDWKSSILVPSLYLLIGNQKQLNPFQKYRDHFWNKINYSGYDCYDWYLYKGVKKNMVFLPFENIMIKNNAFSIECLTNHISDKSGEINYFDYIKRSYSKETSICRFSKDKQVFKYILNGICFGHEKYQGIKDVLDFPLHLQDSFIAHVLISICIYKANNGIQELTSEDYDHIFSVLFGEKVDIKKEAEKDISRNLTYVPNSYDNI